jgi:hypothetical protein
MRPDLAQPPMRSCAKMKRSGPFPRGTAAVIRSAKGVVWHRQQIDRDRGAFCVVGGDHLLDRLALVPAVRMPHHELVRCIRLQADPEDGDESQGESPQPWSPNRVSLTLNPCRLTDVGLAHAPTPGRSQARFGLFVEQVRFFHVELEPHLFADLHVNLRIRPEQQQMLPWLTNR